MSTSNPQFREIPSNKADLSVQLVWDGTQYRRLETSDLGGGGGGSSASPTGVRTTAYAASTGTISLFSGNSSSQGVTVFNASEANLRISYVSPVTSSGIGVNVASSGYYETPYNYVGPLYGSWDVETGYANVQEVF